VTHLCILYLLGLLNFENEGNMIRLNVMNYWTNDTASQRNYKQEYVREIKTNEVCMYTNIRIIHLCVYISPPCLPITTLSARRGSNTANSRDRLECACSDFAVQTWRAMFAAGVVCGWMQWVWRFV